MSEILLVNLRIQIRIKHLFFLLTSFTLAPHCFFLLSNSINFFGYPIRRVSLLCCQSLDLFKTSITDLNLLFTKIRKIDNVGSFFVGCSSREVGKRLLLALFLHLRERGDTQKARVLKFDTESVLELGK